MESTIPVKILAVKLEATASVADRLAFSLKRVQALGLSSLTLEKLGSLSDEEMEMLDACLFRYGSLVSNIQDSVFKSIAEIESEPVSTLSNRDKTNLMERIGVLPSAETFASLAVIRNKLMHNYPEAASQHLERISFVLMESARLIEIFCSILAYSMKFGIRLPKARFLHLQAYF